MEDTDIKQYIEFTGIELTPDMRALLDGTYNGPAFQLTGRDICGSLYNHYYFTRWDRKRRDVGFLQFLRRLTPAMCHQYVDTVPTLGLKAACDAITIKMGVSNRRFPWRRGGQARY